MKVGSTSNCLKYFSLVKDGREEGLVVILAKVCFDYFFFKDENELGRERQWHFHYKQSWSCAAFPTDTFSDEYNCM